MKFRILCAFIIPVALQYTLCLVPLACFVVTIPLKLGMFPPLVIRAVFTLLLFSWHVEHCRFLYALISGALSDAMILTKKLHNTEKQLPNSSHLPESVVSRRHL